ncbi:hypothetical protein PPERSA_02407 [Pseudocohnilembus persalinus]|uniref:Uncharacterized protein n=1 Tax=Pseudocohnilembus persalinus TaxID=266149 RepID=A0A0V0QBD4_PSEPJ|nr:hypothetical protein PPERSA_02407 [Pseudocohnilembus persalinus]|eukprot:KRW99549.1 hypothetical protein PPERSA_02407 [Pseudocohnilembus persalinus]
MAANFSNFLMGQNNQSGNESFFNDKKFQQSLYNQILGINQSKDFNNLVNNNNIYNGNNSIGNNNNNNNINAIQNFMKSYHQPLLSGQNLHCENKQFDQQQQINQKNSNDSGGVTQNQVQNQINKGSKDNNYTGNNFFNDISGQNKNENNTTNNNIIGMWQNNVSNNNSKFIGFDKNNEIQNQNLGQHLGQFSDFFNFNLAQNNKSQGGNNLLDNPQISINQSNLQQNNNNNNIKEISKNVNNNNTPNFNKDKVLNKKRKKAIAKKKNQEENGENDFQSDFEDEDVEEELEDVNIEKTQIIEEKPINQKEQQFQEQIQQLASSYGGNQGQINNQFTPNQLSYFNYLANNNNNNNNNNNSHNSNTNKNNNSISGSQQQQNRQGCQKSLEENKNNKSDQNQTQQNKSNCSQNLTVASFNNNNSNQKIQKSSSQDQYLLRQNGQIYDLQSKKESNNSNNNESFNTIKNNSINMNLNNQNPNQNMQMVYQNQLQQLINSSLDVQQQLQNQCQFQQFQNGNNIHTNNNNNQFGNKSEINNPNNQSFNHNNNFNCGGQISSFQNQFQPYFSGNLIRGSIDLPQFNKFSLNYGQNQSLQNSINQQQINMIQQSPEVQQFLYLDQNIQNFNQQGLNYDKLNQQQLQQLYLISNGINQNGGKSQNFGNNYQYQNYNQNQNQNGLNIAHNNSSQNSSQHQQQQQQNQQQQQQFQQPQQLILANYNKLNANNGSINNNCSIDMKNGAIQNFNDLNFQHLVNQMNEQSKISFNNNFNNNNKSNNNYGQNLEMNKQQSQSVDIQFGSFSMKFPSMNQNFSYKVQQDQNNIQGQLGNQLEKMNYKIENQDNYQNFIQDQACNFENQAEKQNQNQVSQQNQGQFLNQQVNFQTKKENDFSYQEKQSSSFKNKNGSIIKNGINQQISQNNFESQQFVSKESDKDSEQFNTSHVPINMLNNLCKYLLQYFKQTIQCSCPVLNLSEIGVDSKALNLDKNCVTLKDLNNYNFFEKRNKKISKKYLNKIIQQGQQKIKAQGEDICQRCKELNQIVKIKKMKLKNLACFRDLWGFKRIRIVSEYYFMNICGVQILNKNYRSENNRKALYQSLAVFLQGVRNFKQFWKLSD